MRSLVPVGHFRNISGHLFTWLVYGSFKWRHGLLFANCIVWDNKDKAIGFKRSHWIHLGWWSTGSPKFRLFQSSQHSHVTNCRLISSSAYFPWSMTLKYKMQLSEGSLDKILHSTSRTQCFSKEELFFFWGGRGGRGRFVSRSDTPKCSGSSFRDFFVKTTKESWQPFWNHSITRYEHHSQRQKRTTDFTKPKTPINTQEILYPYREGKPLPTLKARNFRRFLIDDAQTCSVNVCNRKLHVEIDERHRKATLNAAKETISAMVS